LPPDARQLVADAMALDVVAAAAEAATVTAVYVVTNDVHVAWAAQLLGAVVVADPGTGLNNALHAPGVNGRVAFLLGDIPALTATALDLALELAATYETSFIVDAAGTGTTLLASSSPTITTHFGANSAALHVAAGYTPLAPVPVALTCDVDTVADLHRAAALGLGERTAHVYNDLLTTGVLTEPS
jgi:2-phospho-L-lactate guanylyltransferase